MGMEIKEFHKIAALIKGSYPQTNYFNDQMTIAIWYDLLKDLDYEVCLNAVRNHICTSRYFPTIAEIRKQCVERLEIPDWGTAWKNVRRAIQHFGSYNEAQALESMDDLTRQVVERMGFRILCLSENFETVDRANFRLIYEQLLKRKETGHVLPLPLQKQNQRIAEILKNKVKLLGEYEQERGVETIEFLPITEICD